MLPWIEHPIEISANRRAALEDVPGLDPKLLAVLRQRRNLASCGMWDICCAGVALFHDICLCFPTGSGKTLAYVIPILQSLIQENPAHVHCLRALILVPTRVLLQQVLGVLSPYCLALNLRLGFLGEAEMTVEKEMLCRKSRNPFRFEGMVDVLLCTPGRLLAHLDRADAISLQYLRFLVCHIGPVPVWPVLQVLDEADHLMKRRHRDCIPVLVNRLHTDRTPHPGVGLRKIVVSATVSRDVQSLKLLELRAPRMLCPQGTGGRRYHFPPGLKHVRVAVPAPLRPLALVGLLHKSQDIKTIIFCSTTEMSQKCDVPIQQRVRGYLDRLTELLREVSFLRGKVLEASGDQSRQSVKKSRKKFDRGEAWVLVASDVMARGMDMENVSQVISYDTPCHAKTYIHRVGRTARVDNCGTAICLLRRQIDEGPFSVLCSKLRIEVETETLRVEDLKPLKPEIDGILNKMCNKRKRP